MTDDTQLLQDKHILYVEDDEFLVDLIVKKLELTGARVTTASSAEAAREALLNDTFDGLLMDLLLPHKSGLELLEELEQEGASPSVPIIIFSNLGQESNIERAQQLGVDKYLVKSNVLPTEIPRVFAELFEKQKADT